MDAMINTAIQYLYERSLSQKELGECLAKQFTGLDNLDEVLSYTLNHLGELLRCNDSRLAKNLAHRFSNKGNRFIIETLKKRGLSEELISQTLASLEPEAVRALQEARKKLPLMKEKRTENPKLVLRSFLKGRCFSPIVIHRVLHQLNKEECFNKEQGTALSCSTHDLIRSCYLYKARTCLQREVNRAFYQ